MGCNFWVYIVTAFSFSLLHALPVNVPEASLGRIVNVSDDVDVKALPRQLLVGVESRVGSFFF